MTIVNRYYKSIVLIGLFIITTVVLYFVKPIAQDLSYHNFSDCRTFFGIPYFMDVISNLFFIIIGFFGFRVASKVYRKRTMAYFLMMFVLFFGVLLTGLGSGFYHLSPNNFTLIFDRLPMTLVFTAFFAAVIYDYLGRRVGAFIFYSLLLIGMYSVFYWYYTEITGKGDLRLYAFVQFFPIIAMPLILWFYKNNNLYTKQLIIVFLAYVMAKLCEHYDAQLFEMLKIISGHTLKHLFSGFAAYMLYRIYYKRVNEKITN